MTRLLNLPDEAFVTPHTFGFVDDFADDDARWTDVTGENGTVTIDADGVGGRVILTTDALNNDAVYRHTNELFLFAARKPMVSTFRAQFTEANTDDANVILGFVNGVAGDPLGDDGAGPVSPASIAAFYKVDGGTRWRCRTGVGSDYRDTEIAQTAGGAGFHSLRVEVNYSPDGAYIIASYFLDPAGGNNLTQCLPYSSGLPQDPRVPLVQHRVAIGSPTEMSVVMGIKAGGANAETLIVDYAAPFGTR